MPISVNEIKERVELIASKDQKTIYLNADKFNKYAPVALDKILQQQRVKMEAGLMSSDALDDLKVRADYVVPTNGQLAKPADYLYYDIAVVNAFNVNKNGEQFITKNPVDYVTDSEFAYRVSSRVSPPTKERPIVYGIEGYWQFYPNNVGIVTLQYIKEPLQPFWNYTVSSNQQVYAETGGVLTNPNAGVTAGDSTDFELPYQFKDDLIFTICELLGVTVRQPDLVQASQALNPKA
jgi:hypothetical protein